MARSTALQPIRLITRRVVLGRDCSRKQSKQVQIVVGRRRRRIARIQGNMLLMHEHAKLGQDYAGGTSVDSHLKAKI